MYKSNSRWSQRRGNKISLEHRAGPTFPTEQGNFGITRNLVPGAAQVEYPQAENSPVCGHVQRASRPRDPRISPALPGHPLELLERAPPVPVGSKQSSDPSTLPGPPRGRRINQRRRNLECHAHPPSRGETAWLCHPQSVMMQKEVGVAAFVGLSFAQTLIRPDKIQGRAPKAGFAVLPRWGWRAWMRAGGGRFQTFQGYGSLGVGFWALEVGGGGKVVYQRTVVAGRCFFVLHLLAIAMAGRWMEVHTVLWILLEGQIV